jgi:hypothetical protein
MTAAEIQAKHEEFQAAVAALGAAQASYETTKAPYLQAKQVLVEAILNVGRIDDELELLTVGYEPPTAPEPV